jgi:DNA-binding CsgD family transcriptional regulator
MYDLIAPPASPQRPLAESPTRPTPEPPTACPRLLGRVLDAMPHGILLVQDDGHVVFANRVARHELDEHHPLQLFGRELRVRRPQDVAPLRNALAGASRKGLQRLLTLGDAATETVTVAIAPAGDPAAGEPAGATLVFGKREVCEDLSADAFARHHGLTSAEARVLKQLCAGRSPTQVARAQGVAISTVRTQIGCIREKTGAHDIGGLLRQVAKLPPLASLIARPREAA